MEIREYGGDQPAMVDEMQHLCATLRVESFCSAPTVEESGVLYVGESGERSTARWQLNRIKAEQRQSRVMHQSGEPVRAFAETCDVRMRCTIRGLSHTLTCGGSHRHVHADHLSSGCCFR